MADSQKAGLAESTRGMVHIVDPAGLKAASCECYATVKATCARLLQEVALVS